jgi:hypothetical protein
VGALGSSSAPSPLLIVFLVPMTSTSLPQPPPPAWSALLASGPMPLDQPSWLTVLAVLLAIMLQQLVVSAAPALMASTNPALAPPPAWTALLATPPAALALSSCQAALYTTLAVPVGPTLQAASGPSPLAAVCVQWLSMMANPASRTQMGTLKPTRTAPSPSQGLAQ